MSAIKEGLVILGVIILVLAVISAAGILGGLLSLLGMLLLVWLGIKAILEL